MSSSCIFQDYHDQDRAGTLAQSLLSVLVRPAWGQGFVSWHLWEHLPQGAGKAVVVRSGALSAISAVAFLSYLNSTSAVLLAGSDVTMKHPDPAYVAEC